MTSKRKQIAVHKFKGLDFLNGPGLDEGSTGETLSIDEIMLPESQPRKYFDPQAMEELIFSVQERGILQPVLVRPHSTEENHYELVAGERRYRAAQAVGLEEIPVIIKSLSDEDAVEIAILENLQRQDLNPVEETEAILGLLSLRINQPREAVISLLNQASHSGSSSADNVIRSTDWEDIEFIFESLGRFTPESFRSNRLPLLSLAEDVLEKLRAGEIQYTKARALAQVKDSRARRRLLKEAIEEKLSLSAIKERVKSSQVGRAPSKIKRPKRAETVLKKVGRVHAKAKKREFWKDKQVLQRVEELLAELDELIGE